MIGVIADAAEHEVVREFFELFKTPWEFYRDDGSYEVVLCSGRGSVERTTAKLVIRYSSEGATASDAPATARRIVNNALSYRERLVPLYGKAASFPSHEGFLAYKKSGECAAFVERLGDRWEATIGYDLFSEVRVLLTSGQPAEHALEPTLELHIAILRDLIAGSGIQLQEVAPVPDGQRFIVCLTHDVDHPLIRNHGWDHTVLGFLYRALFVSVLNVVRGRLGFSDMLRNWWAVIRLPFVQLGLAPDFWSTFGRRYTELEAGLPSTFFVIPFKDRPGRTLSGSAPGFRAARYDAQELAGTIRELRAAGCEVSLHGIDAWIDSETGREELNKIRQLSGSDQVGVRMHWLYFDHNSPATLEAAGATYDSTVGYNNTSGYRAGTTQVYRPLNASHLLELPMHAMDTAFFYPNYLNATPADAEAQLNQLIKNAVEFGGCITINWHDRSVAPERLWGETYRRFIENAKAHGALFLTAADAVAWFRKRRAVSFSEDCEHPVSLTTKAST